MQAGDGNAPRCFAIYLDDYYVSAVQHPAGARRAPPLRRPGSRSGRPRHDPASARFAVVDSPDARPRRAPPRDRRVRRAPRRLHAPDARSSATTWSTTRSAPRSSARRRPGRRSTRSRCTWPIWARDARRCLLVSEQADPMLRRRGLESLPTSSSVMRTANRANVVDLRARSAGRCGPGRRAGRGAEPAQRPGRRHRRRSILAASPVRPARGSRRALRQMVADASAYYLLTYRSTQEQRRDVPCRRRLGEGERRAAAGAEGFLGAVPGRNPAREPAGTCQRSEAARAASARRSHQPVSSGRGSAWRRGANGNTRVTFVWEPAGAVPGDRRVRTPSRVEFKALGANGTTVFEGPVRPTGAVVGRTGGHRRRLARPCSRCRLAESAWRCRFEDCGGRVDRHRCPRSPRRRSAGAGRDWDARSAARAEPRGMFARSRRIPTPCRLLRASSAGPSSSSFECRSTRPDGAPDVTAQLLNSTGQSMRPLTVEPAATPDGRAQIRSAARGPRARRLFRGNRGGKPRRPGQGHTALSRDQLTSNPL